MSLRDLGWLAVDLVVIGLLTVILGHAMLAVCEAFVEHFPADGF